MEAKKTSKSSSPVVRERAVRMVVVHRAENASQWTTIFSIAAKIVCSGETLQHWVRDRGARRHDDRAPGLPSLTPRLRASLALHEIASRSCWATDLSPRLGPH